MATHRPDFFIVGAPKCGTTAMYHALAQHPEIFIPERKDVPYFGSDLDVRFTYQYGTRRENLEEYLSWFTPDKPVTRIGDACVWYMYSRCAGEEIKRFAPDAAIIAMLRNPVDMMYSQHSQFLTNLNEDLDDFGEAIAAEGERARGQRLPRHVHLAQGLQYRATGRYAEQLERYFDLFGPERVHVVIYDDFRKDSEAEIRRVLEFLRVDPTAPLDLGIVNPNKAVRSKLLQRLAMAPPGRLEAIYHALTPRAAHGVLAKRLRRLNIRHQPRPPLDPELRRRLQGEMAPEVERLSRLLQRDLSAWVTEGA